MADNNNNGTLECGTPEICASSLVWKPEIKKFVENPGQVAREEVSEGANIVGEIPVYTAENVKLPSNVKSRIDDNLNNRPTELAKTIRDARKGDYTYNPTNPGLSDNPTNPGLSGRTEGDKSWSKAGARRPGTPAPTRIATNGAPVGSTRGNTDGYDRN